MGWLCGVNALPCVLYRRVVGNSVIARPIPSSGRRPRIPAIPAARVLIVQARTGFGPRSAFARVSVPVEYVVVGLTLAAWRCVAGTAPHKAEPVLRTALDTIGHANHRWRIARPRSLAGSLLVA